MTTDIKILAEFIADVEAVGVATVEQEWPDLYATYERAKATMHSRNDEDKPPA